MVDYLEHKIKKNDKSDYGLIQGDFEPIISVEDFENAGEIKAERTKKTPDLKSYGIKTSKNKWMNLMECGCGSV